MKVEVFDLHLSEPQVDKLRGQIGLINSDQLHVKPIMEELGGTASQIFVPNAERELAQSLLWLPVSDKQQKSADGLGLPDSAKRQVEEVVEEEAEISAETEVREEKGVEIDKIKNHAFADRFKIATLAAAVFLTAIPAEANAQTIPGVAVVGITTGAITTTSVVGVQPTNIGCGVDPNFQLLISQVPPLAANGIIDCAHTDVVGNLIQDFLGPTGPNGAVVENTCVKNVINGLPACTNGAFTTEDDPFTNNQPVQRPNNSLFPWEIGTQVITSPVSVVQPFINTVSPVVSTEVIGVIQPGQTQFVLNQPSVIFENGATLVINSGQRFEIGRANHNRRRFNDGDFRNFCWSSGRRDWGMWQVNGACSTSDMAAPTFNPERNWQQGAPSWQQGSERNWHQGRSGMWNR